MNKYLKTSYGHTKQAKNIGNKEEIKKERKNELPEGQQSINFNKSSNYDLEN